MTKRKAKTKPKRRRRRHSEEFKREAVHLITVRGVSTAQAARDLDVHATVLRRWVTAAGSKGVRANCICPGVVETPMFEQVLSIGLITREQVSDMAAIGRTIRPEEIANLVLFLASDESSAITGQAIVIDGGLISGCDLTGIPPAS